MPKLFFALSLLLVPAFLMGCGTDNGTTFIAPAEGARELTPEEIEEFNANSVKDWEPVIQD